MLANRGGGWENAQDVEVKLEKLPQSSGRKGDDDEGGCFHCCRVICLSLPAPLDPNVVRFRQGAFLVSYQRIRGVLLVEQV